MAQARANWELHPARAAGLPVSTGDTITRQVRPAARNLRRKLQAGHGDIHVYLYLYLYPYLVATIH